MFTLCCCCILVVYTGNPLLAQAVPVKVSYNSNSGYFPLVNKSKAASLYIDAADAEVVSIAATAFQNDIKLMAGLSPAIIRNSKNLIAYPVIIGTIGQSALINQLIKSKKIQAEKVRGKWETFSIAVVNNPFPKVKQALVIFGSDKRGTAFGVFELSRMMGVSPFVWWADVVPAHHDAVYITPGKSIEGPPSVKYRGIFLNDEDWGLRPWAAKNMDVDKKDIGPKTYAHIFELMLRLKANYLWPAMHPGTKAFWYYKENPVLARKYAIVMGSSHHEPMLRNTEFEWNENFKEEYGKAHGDWRYDTNKEEIYRFFDDRAKQSVNNDAIYTVGMRATKDGAMSGPPTVQGKIKVLEDVIHDQREILAKRLGKPADEIPQLFCPYREVLPLYQAGLKVPEDVTILWVDDNHGYIRQLSNPAEQKRSGGSGVYYHFSYWGTPQDYLWLCSTSPTLTSYEMTKAYQFNARRIWVFNVGDLKPAELETQFAMDLAWDVNKWPPEKAGDYALSWAKETFGEAYALRIAAIKAEYYRLAAAGKPEHIDLVSYTEAEADQRLKDYQELANQAQELAKSIPERLQDAYYELILYPVEGAKLMNEKILYAKKSIGADVNANAAVSYLKKAQHAYDQIQSLTKKYNDSIAGGKWSGMMDAHPREIPMFNAPQKLLDQNRQNPAYSLVKDSSIDHIPASAYQRKQDLKGFSIKTIAGLGITGRGVTVLPFPDKSFAENEISKAPYVAYKVKLAKGNNRITVKCLPTFRVYDGLLMRYGIAVNDGPVQVVGLKSFSETKPWEINVLRGYTQGETVFKADKNEETTVKIYLPDPGLVINELEVKPL
ncbi:glycosyl hydrolase 115 family protein [Mucilaginibacter sp.]|uniref:glycosyl hydrolase 115 family protein n=1 Tax=Mucilaginibacter sp. TaxID=1882438 RepID=UPI003B003447